MSYLHNSVRNSPENELIPFPPAFSRNNNDREIRHTRLNTA